MNIIKTTTAPSSPGIYAGISNAAYHAGPGISKSGLDLMAKSPYHYWSQYISDHRETREETPAMRLGTLVHTAILEPHETQKWVVIDQVDFRTKAGMAAKAAAEEKAAVTGGPILRRNEYNLIKAMADAVYAHPIAEHFETGVPELSVYWIDEDSGVFCRCRPDWLGTTAVVDVKTTEDASPTAFKDSAWHWRYWTQAAFYLDGLAANGIDKQYFIFAAVEKSRPHSVVAYPAAEDFLEAGRWEYKRLLKLYSDCATANVWPGYPPFVDLTVPAFARNRLFTDNAFASNNEST